MKRTTRDVFEDHLALAREGDVDTDIQRNFSPDCVLLSSDGVFRRHAGIRDAAAVLADHLPKARYTYRTRLVEGELAFLEWTGDSAETQVRDGADSFVIRDGVIVAMTAHYTVEPKQRSTS